MLRIMVNNTFLNDICGRILGSESRFIKSALIFILIALGLLLAGTWQVLKHFSLRNYTVFRNMQTPQVKTT